MKNVFHILVCFCNWSVLAQPVSDDLMNLRMESLEKAIHKNPLNDSLIWERIELSSLGFPDFDVVLNFEFTEVKRQTALELKKRFSSDFERIERKHIAKKKFNLVEEGDFYLNRIWYNFNCLEFDKAIADAIHLRDSASYSKYEGRGEYYNEWANLSLFYLYIFKQEFTLAFQTSDVILNQLKIKKPKQYYSSYDGSQQNKLILLDFCNKKEELTNYLKFLTRECFEHYFEMRSFKDSNFSNTLYISENESYSSEENYSFHTESTKEYAFNYLQQLLVYLDKYTDPDLPYYQIIYNQLAIKVNPNFEKINVTINDKELKSIISKI